MCDCKNSVAKDFDPGNRGLSHRHVPPVETLRCFISAAKEVTPFHSRACVLKTCHDQTNGAPFFLIVTKRTQRDTL